MMTRNSPTPGRHIYDLHMMRDLVDPAEVATLARAIAAADAQEFDNQFPAYTADIAGETCRALDALRTDPTHARRYADFVAAMVYGEPLKIQNFSRTALKLRKISMAQ